MDLVTLADLPELSTDATPQSRITIARMGKYQDARYGKFEIGEAEFTGWQRNLSETFANRIAVDFDHSSDRGRGTEAAAWITGLERQGKDLVADVKWTPKGAAAVRDGAYAFFSPTYVANYRTEKGEDRGQALIGGALTNRPVLRQLPTLSLSREDIDGVATVRPKGAAKRERKRARQLSRARDSRPQMNRDELLIALGLDEDADQATVISAVLTLSQPPASPPSPSRVPSNPTSSRPTKSGRTAGIPDGEAPGSKKARKLAKKLKAKQAMALDHDEDGNVVLDEERFAQLLLDANAGAGAATQLARDRFDHAWEKALSEGRAAPSQEANLRELHDMNPDLAIKTLDSFVAIVPTTPKGSGDGAPSGPAPLGMDDDRYQLHKQAEARAKQLARENPGLPAGEAYALAALELDDAQHGARDGDF